MAMIYISAIQNTTFSYICDYSENYFAMLWAILKYQI